jgi:hypothetical protein
MCKFVEPFQTTKAFKKETETEEKNVSSPISTECVLELIKQNKELQQILIDKTD